MRTAIKRWVWLVLLTGTLTSCGTALEIPHVPSLQFSEVQECEFITMVQAASTGGASLTGAKGVVLNRLRHDAEKVGGNAIFVELNTGRSGQARAYKCENLEGQPDGKADILFFDTIDTGGVRTDGAAE